MSKFFLYFSLLLLAAAAVLGYLNERRFKEIILNKEAIIQKQHDTAAALEKEIKNLQESAASQADLQEKNKKELSDAEEAQAQAAHDLTAAQKQLADKEAEVTQTKK